jgi:chromosomal replication initiator protein
LARQSDLVVIEDLHHACTRTTPTTDEILTGLTSCFDYLLVRQRQMVFTANVGPAQLAGLPRRLVNRFAGGLVVGLEPLQAPSRLRLLEEKAQRRQLAVSREVLVWLADHLTGGRQLEGALVQLEALGRLHRRAPDLAKVVAHFREQAEIARPTVARIAHRVGIFFRIEPRQLQSRRRYQNVLLPRQVGMYLARQLTDLSLDEIGAYFGGRDHSTVLHACRKIEAALGRDAALSGAVKQLHADLG